VYIATVTNQIDGMGSGIYAVGVCTNTQFSCNDLIGCRHGFYFQPGTGAAATYISNQGWFNSADGTGRASDNFWQNTISDRIAGDLNIDSTYGQPKWFFRGNHDSQPYSPDIAPGSFIYYSVVPKGNTNVLSRCTGLPEPIEGEDIDGALREQRYGDIVREEISYEVLEEEFEYFNEEYLYEVLYSNPDIMYLGEPDDSSYINFYNYLTNSTIAEFVEIQELIDTENINDALQNNGIVVAQTLIETNKQIVNDIYLNTLAQKVDFDSNQRQTLLSIAMLTPYIGGDGVYTARVMLGIDPDDYNLLYSPNPFGNSYNGRKKDNEAKETFLFKIYPNPAKEKLTVEFYYSGIIEKTSLILYSTLGVKIETIVFNTNRVKHTFSVKDLKPGVYFYEFLNNYETKSGKIIIEKQ